MSKTTIALFIILFFFVGLLLFIVFGLKQNQLIDLFTKPHPSQFISPDTTLSLSTPLTTVRNGQTVTVAVLINNPDPHLNLVQIELSYDPLALTVDSLAPGTFFTNPTIALQNIDPVVGRISYALHCPVPKTENTANNCVNATSPTIAVITFTINPYTIDTSSTLSFLPKTVIRTANGRDILKRITGLHLILTKSLYPISSSSAVASSGATVIHVTPVH